jgi:hypothetical protein
VIKILPDFQAELPVKLDRIPAWILMLWLFEPSSVWGVPKDRLSPFGPARIPWISLLL